MAERIKQIAEQQIANKDKGVVGVDKGADKSVDNSEEKSEDKG